jgi:hypothetical protein
VADGGSPAALEHMARLNDLEKEGAWKAPQLDKTKVSQKAAEVYGDHLATERGMGQMRVAERIFFSLAMREGVEPDLKTDAGNTLFEKALQIAAGASYTGAQRYGGVDTVNGLKVQLPVGMKSGAVQLALNDANESYIAWLGAPKKLENGQGIRPAQLRDARLHPVGDGRYAVALYNRFSQSYAPVIVEPDARGAATDRWGLSVWTISLEDLLGSHKAVKEADPNMGVGMTVMP